MAFFKKVKEGYGRFQDWKEKQREAGIVSEHKRTEFLKAKAGRLEQEAKVAKAEAIIRKSKHSYKPDFGQSTFIGGSSMFGGGGAFGGYEPKPPKPKPTKRKRKKRRKSSYDYETGEVMFGW